MRTQRTATHPWLPLSGNGGFHHRRTISTRWHHLIFIESYQNPRCQNLGSCGRLSSKQNVFLSLWRMQNVGGILVQRHWGLIGKVSKKVQHQIPGAERACEYTQPRFANVSLEIHAGARHINRGILFVLYVFMYCMSLHVYMCACGYAYTCVWRPQADVWSLPLLLFTLSFETGPLIGHRAYQLSEGVPGTQLSLFPTPKIRGIDRYDMPGFYIGARDLNSGPHACMARTLPNGSISPAPKCSCHSRKLEVPTITYDYFWDSLFYSLSLTLFYFEAGSHSAAMAGLELPL